MKYSPPFTMTDTIAALLVTITEQVTRISITQEQKHMNPKLRRENRIRTIQASLAIEQNTLTLDQVTAILDGKRVLGNPNEIKEVKNAYDAYELLLTLDPLSLDDLLRAHRLMMQDLITENGQIRRSEVAIYREEGGARIPVHMGPPAYLVPTHMENLFAWYKESTLPILLKSTIFHYEFEFIHPFADGNGRMGRMWHTLLLAQWQELFYWLPIEELIQTRQADYYEALGIADRTGDSSVFVELLLTIIKDTLEELVV